MQNSGLEWSFRLAQEPRRLWRRYGRDILVFGRKFTTQWWALRPPRRPVPAVFECPVLAGGEARLTLRGCILASGLPEFHRRCAEALAYSSLLRLDLSQVQYIDAVMLGGLVSLARQAVAAGGRIELDRVSPNLQTILTRSVLDRYFQESTALQNSIATSIEPGS